MKILIINSYYYPNMIGGTEYSIKLDAEELKKRGHDVLIFSVDSKKSKQICCNINGITVKRIKGILHKKSYNKIFYWLMDFYNPFIDKKLSHIINKFQPDVVWTNNLFYISTYIWKYIKVNFNIPIVHTIRDIWLYCPRSKLSKHPALCQNVVCKLFRKNATKMSEYVDVVIAPSKAFLKYFISSGFFKNAKKEIIYNAIDYNKDRILEIIKERMVQKKENINYLYIGRLSDQKGVKLLIESFKQFENPNTSLIICGDGELKDYVIKSSRQDCRIKYLGYVINDMKDEVFKNSDVLILPSLGFEAFGRVIIEAYKWGIPVIATDIGGISEVVVNGKTGILLDVNSDLKCQLIDALRIMSYEHIRYGFMQNILPQLQRFLLKDHIDRMEEIFLYSKRYKKVNIS